MGQTRSSYSTTLGTTLPLAHSNINNEKHMRINCTCALLVRLPKIMRHGKATDLTVQLRVIKCVDEISR